MKGLILITMLTVGFSCSKTKTDKVVIDKDCTGTYIETKSNHYRVCNAEVLDAYAEGDEIKVTYHDLKKCDDEDEIRCELYHPHDGNVEIEKVD